MTEASISVSAAEANRSFSRLLRAAQEGTRITITSHGRPVAQLGPIEEQGEAERRAAAVAALVERWRNTTPQVIGPWTREELYDRG